MAIPPIEVKALWDGTELSSGLNTSATEITTTLPAATDTAAVDLTTKATKFKAVGTELGTSLAQGVAGGVDPATSVVNVGSSLSGLLAASAATAGGAAAAVGLGLGVALIKGMLDSAKANAAEMQAGVSDLLGAVEDDFKGSLDSIIRQMRSSFSKVDAITELGGGELGAGWAELERISRLTGINIHDLVDYLQGKGTPAAQAVADQFARGAALQGDLGVELNDTNKQLLLNYGVSKDLVEQAGENAAKWAQATDAARGLHDLMIGTKHETQQAADEAGRLAANLQTAQRNANIHVDVGV